MNVDRKVKLLLNKVDYFNDNKYCKLGLNLKTTIAVLCNFVTTRNVNNDKKFGAS